MPYMDFLLDGSTEALVLAGDSATLVKVPDPARYGLHKLLVAGERPVVEQTKVVKDIAQASEILGFLLERRPVDVEIAFASLVRKGYHKKALASAHRHLDGNSPVLHSLVGNDS